MLIGLPLSSILYSVLKNTINDKSNKLYKNIEIYVKKV